MSDRSHHHRPRRRCEAGDRNVKVASVAGLAVGAQIGITPGPAQDHVTITNVGTAGVSTSVSVANPAAGAAAERLWRI